LVFTFAAALDSLRLTILSLLVSELVR